MAFHLTEDNEPAPLKIAGAIDIYDAFLLRDTLQRFIESRAEILLDLSEVESCDVSTAQLLLAALKSAQKVEKHFSVVDMSPAIVGTFAMLGLSAEQLKAE